MMKDKNNANDRFDDALRRKLENYTVPVDDADWNAIERRLAPRKRAIWPWISAAALAACFILVWIIFPFSNKYKQDEYAELPYNEPQVTASLLATTDESQPAEETLGSTVRIGQRSQPSPLLSQPEIAEATTATTGNASDRSAEEAQAPVIIAQDESVEEDRHFPLPSLHALSNVPERYELNIPRKKKRSSLSLNLGSENNLLAMNDDPKGNSSYAGLRSTSIQKTPEELINKIPAANDFNSTKHYSPLTFGLSVRKDLTSRLALESGINYSYLYTEFSNDYPRRDATLALHYIGIPVNLSYSVYRSHPQWNVYVAAGGMVEKGLYSKFNYHFFEEEAIYSTDSSTKIRGLQWSVNAMIGADYRISKDLSVYFEPKITYYLRNSQPLSIRSKNPVIVGFNAGLRFDI